MFNVVRRALLSSSFGLCSVVTKLFTIILCRESRYITSCQNFLLYIYMIKSLIKFHT
jgi:hypothetical protein